MMRPVAAAGLATALLVVAAAPALAANYKDLAGVKSALANDRVFIADDAEVAAKVSHDDLKAATNARIAVVVLPSRAGNAQSLATQLTTDSGGRVAIVLTGASDFGGAETRDGPFGKGEVASLVQSAASQHGGDPEGALVAAVSTVRARGSAESGSGSTGSGSSGSGSSGSGSSGSGSSGSGSTGGGGGALLGGIVAVGAVGGGGYLVARSRRRKRQAAAAAAAARAEVESLYQRLGNDVSTLSPGDNAIARQAMADASERYTATGALLSRADIDTAEELQSAKRTAIEGISAARVARKQLGLDPGLDPMPAPPPQAPQVQGQQTVAVGNQTYTGYGAYQPGAGHYFGGGYYQGGYVPGGWYATPFWETALISSIAWGGLGWGGGYGGFGGGYGGGYDEGYEQGERRGDDSGGGGGGWSDGGGGGWDSGGGWGGGGDGGGWGGGGGDGGGGGGDGGGGGGGGW